MHHLRCASWSCLLLTLAAAAQAEDDSEFFARRVQPLLEKRCYSCHSHRADDVQAGLMLDSRSGWAEGGNSGPAVVPGKPDESLLVKAIRRTDKALQMPPDAPLAADETAILVEWVQRGAFDPRNAADVAATGGWAETLAERKQHWCWQPVVRPALPAVADGALVENPIDAFWLARLNSEGLNPSAPADRWALARRLAFALTGLPPDAEQAAAFVADDAPGAYARYVERLLASPELGVHWARHWMDLVKYSDSHGSEHDPLIPHAWRYRDYVVRAFNADLPYDRFVREHVAGDLLPPRWHPSLGINESPLGTGYLRFVEFYPTPIDVKNEEIVVLDAQIDAFGKTFQGLTLACARCHDHKFDAVSARDFAALYGIFASTRTTMHRLEDPAVFHAQDEKISQIKQQVRGSLAGLWLEQLPHWPEALRGARTQLLQPPPEKPPEKDAKPVPPPFTAGTRSVEAETYRWHAALKAAHEKPAEPLHAWARVVKESGAAADPVLDAKLWTDLATAAQAAAMRRATQYSDDPNKYQLFADFGTDHSRHHPPGDEPVTRSVTSTVAGWHAHDNFLASSAPGDFALEPAGANVVTAIYPAGRYSHLLSNKHGGTFRSPNFTLDKQYVSVLVCGINTGRLKLVIENFCSDTLLFDAAMPKVNNPRLHWVSLPTREAWRGKRAYVEIHPRDDMPYPGKLPDARQIYTDGRSGVGIREVVRHDVYGIPELPPTLPDAFWEPADDWTAVVARFTDRARQAIEAWRDGRCTDEDARLVDALLRAGVLLNEPPADHPLAQQIAAYRQVEALIPLPTRALGAADEIGFDERLFPRGNHRKPGEAVPRRYLEALGGRPFTGTPERPLVSGRAELAELLVDRANPLTARVMVNRLWQHMYGVGLVATVDNFGQLGERPSHPELLDWLAAEFVDSGWSIKHMLRLMATSRAFQGSTTAAPLARERDPANRWLSHAHVRRLEAESLRDTLLAVSGRLDPTQGGLGVPLPLPLAYKDFENPVPGPLDGAGRRSLYLEVRRNYPQPLLVAFDQPKPVLTVGQRNMTNVPAQSLMLLNDKFVAQQAGLLAAHLLTLPDPADRIRTLIARAFSRPASEAEVARALEYLKDQAGLLGLADDAWKSDAALWQDLAHAVLNQKEFLYLK